MIRLLFLCTNNSARSQMAEAFAKTYASDGVTVNSAGTHPVGEVHPLAIEVMTEIGRDISNQHPSSISQQLIHEIDIAITLCATAANECQLLLPGHPVQINWNLPNPAKVEGSHEERLTAFRETREQIHKLVDDFFHRGYLKALAWANNKSRLLLNSLSEGIIVHDIERKIIYFNKAAEEITGYSRDEVIGCDCHEVFPGNFCGPKCSFCDTPPTFSRIKYPLNITTKSGETRHTEVSVQAIADSDGEMLGVLASFRDLTNHYNMARRLGEIESFAGIIGRDQKMLEVFDLIRSVADVNVPVFIQGESGTGKELVAAAIHREGVRANKLFVPINCGALPEGLLESELFGHVRGAFTGAIRDKKGRFELADGGTIFLDEIGDLSLHLQVKLLRVLQEGTFERVGDTKTTHTNVRVISATNKDIQAEIAAGRFRTDLYYRLCVVPIELPPLRERYSDIPLLVDVIIKRVMEKGDDREVVLAPEALDILMSYSWPGNIRELQNTLQYALVKCRDTVIQLEHLPPNIISTVSQGGYTGAIKRNNGNIPQFEREVSKNRVFTPVRDHNISSRNKLTVEMISNALRQTNGNRAQAARVLGVGRATLYRFLTKHAQTFAETNPDFDA